MPSAMYAKAQIAYSSVVREADLMWRYPVSWRFAAISF